MMGVSSIVSPGSSLEDDVMMFNNGSVVMRDETPDACTEALFTFERSLRERRLSAAKSRAIHAPYFCSDTYFNILFTDKRSFRFPPYATVEPPEGRPDG